jgi:hypothetical protein
MKRTNKQQTIGFVLYIGSCLTLAWLIIETIKFILLSIPALNALA